jgi:hypothetical protein
MLRRDDDGPAYCAIVDGYGERSGLQRVPLGADSTSSMIKSSMPAASLGRCDKLSPCGLFDLVSSEAFKH